MGFTLVELLIAIVVIAILAAISIVSYTGIQDRAYTSTTATNIRNYISGLELMKIEQGHYWADATNSVKEVCLGTGNGSDEDCGTTTYQGSGCSAFGIEPGSSTSYDISYNDDFNQAMKQYFGSIPRGVQTKPSSMSQIIGDCTATITLRSAIYQSANQIIVSPNIVGYDRSGGNNGKAYSIQYAVPGDDCVISGARSIEEIFPDANYDATDGNICYLFGGKVTFM